MTGALKPASGKPVPRAHQGRAVQVPDTFGAPFGGGHYGGQIRIGAALYAVAWAPKAQGETEAAWLPSYTDVPGACSYCDSHANTLALVEAGSPIATWARGLVINGFSDWCVPARDVLELAYRNLKPTTEQNYTGFRDGDNPSSVPVGYPYTEASPAQASALAFRDDNAEAFEPVWYWSSTQYSGDDAWGQDFGNGSQDYGTKEVEARCRAVRLIQLTP